MGTGIIINFANQPKNVLPYINSQKAKSAKSKGDYRRARNYRRLALVKRSNVRFLSGTGSNVSINLASKLYKYNAHMILFGANTSPIPCIYHPNSF